VLQSQQKMKTLTARLAKKFTAIRAEPFKTTPMVEPRDSSREGKQNLKPRAPQRPFQWQKPELRRTKPVRVKIDVALFITQNSIADLLEDWITRARMKQPVICRPHQLRDNQHLQLEIQTDRATNDSKNRLRPMPSNRLSAKSMH